jgi:colanic acid biosynthesis protein WcaH
MKDDAESKIFLTKTVFKEVVNSTPLISIDLVVRNDNSGVLLGLRKNRPAAGFWFVLGGRIYKNESIENAFKRLTSMELGIEISISNAKYLGLYEHFYDDSVFGDDLSGGSVSTHYVVNGFEINLSDLSVLDENNFMSLPKDQHDEYCWLTESQLLNKENVHIHSKWYFNKEKGFI